MSQLQTVAITVAVMLLMAAIAPLTRPRRAPARETDRDSDRPPYLLYAFMGLNMLVLLVGVAVAGAVTFL